MVTAVVPTTVPTTAPTTLLPSVPVTPLAQPLTYAQAQAQ